LTCDGAVVQGGVCLPDRWRGEGNVARIIPVGGGKGGIGKSFVTANLGSLLAGRGEQVAVVDLDLGGPNLHTFFGLEQVG
jgi:MinD-like ATPase involved in chromosome partitioning or flagellar assembly